MSRVLVVDDEPRFRVALARSLRGHDYVVEESGTGENALSDFETFRPDVVLLDLMLPGTDGLTVCRKLREHSDCAIIVLSVIGDEAVKVRALDQGADDYLTKPFDSEELLARIRAVLRRAAPSGESDSFSAGPLRFDLSKEVVYLNGEEIRLTASELNLLHYFVENAGRVLRHKAILTNVWGPEYAGDTQILRTYIKQLRSKLKDDPAKPRFIRTELGIGYRFALPD